MFPMSRAAGSSPFSQLQKFRKENPMRLKQFRPGSIRVRRGGSGGGGSRMGSAGGIGCGGLVVVLIGIFVFGADPGQMIGMVEGAQQGAPSQQQAPSASNESDIEICDDNAY